MITKDNVVSPAEIEKAKAVKEAIVKEKQVVKK